MNRRKFLLMATAPLGVAILPACGGSGNSNAATVSPPSSSPPPGPPTPPPSVNLGTGTVSVLNVQTENPTNPAATIGIAGIGPLRSIKHHAIIENTVAGYYSPAASEKKITLFSGDWTDGWPTSQRSDYPPNAAWGDDGRQEIWDADISNIPAITDPPGTLRFKLANNFYHNYPWNGSTGYSGAGGFGGVEPQRGPYMPDGVGFVIDKRGQHWMGPCDVGYTGVNGDAAGEQFGAWAPMYRWTKPGLHSNGVRYGNGWTRPNQNRLKRRGAGNYGYTAGADWDVGITSDSEAVGWGRPNQTAYDPVNDCIWVVGVNAGNTDLTVALYKFPCVPTAGTHTWVRYPLSSVPLSRLGGPTDSTSHASTSSGDGDICNTVWCNGSIYFTHTQQYTVPATSDWQTRNGYISSTTRRVARIVKVVLDSGSPALSALDWVPFPAAANWWLRAYDGPEGGEAASLGYTPLTTSQYRSLKALGNKLILGPDAYIKVADDPWIWVYDTDTKVWSRFDPPASYAITNGGHDWPQSIFSTVVVPSLGEVWLCGKSAAPGSEMPEESWMLSKGMHSANIYQRKTGVWCGRRIIRFKVA